MVFHPPKLAVQKSYVRLANLVGSEAWRLRVNVESKWDVNIEERAILDESNVWAQFKYSNGTKDLMLIFDRLMDQLTMAHNAVVVWARGAEDEWLRVEKNAGWKEKMDEKWLGGGRLKRIALRLSKEYVLCWSTWNVGVDQIANWLRWTHSPWVVADTFRFVALVSLYVVMWRWDHGVTTVRL